MVSCETLDVEDTVRDFERRYHSSGTQNRNDLLADAPIGLGASGVSRIGENSVLKGILVDSVVAHEYPCSMVPWWGTGSIKIKDPGLTLGMLVRPNLFHYIL